LLAANDIAGMMTLKQTVMIAITTLTLVFKK
jgi:hypothetical protein